MKKQLLYKNHIIFGITKLIFSIIFCLVMMFSIITCKKSDEEIVIIEDIDIKEMAKIHLTDFLFVRERDAGAGTEYVFSRDGVYENIYINMGICSSAEKADSIVNSYMSNMAGVPQTGSLQGISIGDKFWWLTRYSNSTSRVAEVFFIRHNVYFMMNVQKYPALLDLAKKIDNDILTKASYIKFKN